MVIETVSIVAITVGNANEPKRRLELEKNSYTHSSCQDNGTAHSFVGCYSPFGTSADQETKTIYELRTTCVHIMLPIAIIVGGTRK